jgi:uncharacterized protein (UPF0335 family)
MGRSKIATVSRDSRLSTILHALNHSDKGFGKIRDSPQTPILKEAVMISDADRADQMGQATREKLKQFIARIERLEAEKAELATDIREVYSEVKSFGFDTKVMRKVISLRKQDAAERAEQEALLDMYMEVVADQ